MTKWRNELKYLYKLAIPVIISQVGNMSMNMVDTWVLGRSNSLDLAGVAAGNSVFFPLMVMSIGLMFGMDPLITRFNSLKDHHHTKLVFSQSTLIVIGTSIIGSPLIYFGSHFFSFTGASPEIVTHAEPYIKSLAFSYPLTLMFHNYQRYWQALEIAFPVTIIILFANIVNLVLDLAFVEGWFGLAPLGSAGVGWASFGCRIFQLLAIALLTHRLIKKGFPFPHFNQFLHFHRRIMGQIMRLGLPAALQLGLEVTAFNLVTVIASQIGPLPLASHHIVLGLASFSFMFPVGIANATAIRVGIHRGSEDYQRAKLAGHIGILLGAMVMAIFACCFLVFPKWLLQLFTIDPEVITLALTITTWCALFQVVDGIQVVAGGALRGIGDTKSSFYTNLISFYIIGLPAAIYLCFEKELALVGLWIGLALSLGFVAILNTLIWIKKSRRFIS